jgi:E3 ubiquitin-protein ligase SHPRH
MINQSKDKIKEAESGFSATCLRHAGMHEILEEWQLALNIYLDGVKFNETRVDEARKDVEDAKAEAAEERNAGGSAPVPEVEVKSADSEKKQNALSIARNRLSNCLLLLHRFLFYAAGMYHELKDEDNEAKLYDRAEEIRRELLRQSQNKVSGYLDAMSRNETLKNSFQILHYSSNPLLKSLTKASRPF